MVCVGCGGIRPYLIFLSRGIRVQNLGEHAYKILEQVKSGQVKSGQVKSEQVKPGQVKSGLVKSGQVRW